MDEDIKGASSCITTIAPDLEVAALGSAWGEQHFNIIKKAASKVCLLPDAEPPKHSEHYGHGVKVVMAAGLIYNPCQLAVLHATLVARLPLGIGHLAHDAALHRN